LSTLSCEWLAAIIWLFRELHEPFQPLWRGYFPLSRAFSPLFAPHALHKPDRWTRTTASASAIKALEERQIFSLSSGTARISRPPLHRLSLTNMMFFSSSLFVLALSPFVVASPTPAPNEVARQDSSPNASVVPLTLFTVLQTLNEAVLAITPGLETIVASSGPEGQLPSASVVPLLNQLADALRTSTGQLAAVGPGNMGAADEVIGKLVETTLNDVNDALNKLVPKLGLNAVLTPLDGALTGLLTGLSPVLAPVIATVGAILVPVGGVVGGLLATLNLSGL
ncbi:hypothetical protein DFH06DRAFT_265108, partial [Mycena polygramma]